MRDDVAPSAAQRWIARHRSGVRVGILTFLVVVVAFWVWSLTRSDGGGGFRVVLAVIQVAVVGSLLVNLRGISRYVDRWDASHPAPQVR